MHWTRIQNIELEISDNNENDDNNERWQKNEEDDENGDNDRNVDDNDDGDDDCNYVNGHANLVCHGIIPSIISNEVQTAVKRMAPDAQQTMDQQVAITDAGNAGGGKGSVEGEVKSGRRDTQFKSLNSEHLKSNVSSLRPCSNQFYWEGF